MLSLKLPVHCRALWSQWITLNYLGAKEALHKLNRLASGLPDYALIDSFTETNVSAEHPENIKGQLLLLFPWAADEEVAELISPHCRQQSCFNKSTAISVIQFCL